MAQPHAVSPTALMRLIGTAQTPVIVDVSLDEDVEADPFLLPTARRCAHHCVETLVPDIAERDVVVVCQKGRKLSQGAAALLRTRGVAARALEGGNLGWRAAGLPRLALARLPASDGTGRWVAPTHPRMETFACAWLIRRFMVPRAEFLFVPEEDIPAVAERFSAAPLPNANPTDKAGPLRALLSRYGLEFPPLLTLAATVSAPDPGAPAGLLEAVDTGLRLGTSSDLQRLETAMTLFDALYLWARDARTGEVAA